MPSRTELVDALAAELRAAEFQDGQHNGLQIEGTDEIDKIVTAVSVNQESIDAAIAADADALLTHHGIQWHTDPLHWQGHRARRFKAAFAADLNVLSYHLPLDAHPTLGNNAALTDAAGCDATVPAFAHKGTEIGCIGEREPIAFDDWVQGFEAALRHGCAVPTGPFNVWEFGPEQIQKIGFVSGGAPYDVHAAVAAGCDVFVTGEAAESVYHVAKEEGIHFIAGGHYLTERGGVQRVGDWLATKFGVEATFVDVGTQV